MALFLVCPGPSLPVIGKWTHTPAAVMTKWAILYLLYVAIGAPPPTSLA